jgi:hypothetical protein
MIHGKLRPVSLASLIITSIADLPGVEVQTHRGAPRLGGVGQHPDHLPLGEDQTEFHRAAGAIIAGGCNFGPGFADVQQVISPDWFVVNLLNFQINFYTLAPPALLHDHAH